MNSSKAESGTISLSIDGTPTNLDARMVSRGTEIILYGRSYRPDKSLKYVLNIYFPKTLTGQEDFGNNGVRGILLEMDQGADIAGDWIRPGQLDITYSEPNNEHFEGTFHGDAGDINEGDTSLKITEGRFDLTGYDPIELNEEDILKLLKKK